MLPAKPENKPVDKKEGHVISAEITEHFSGPLPHPRILEDYDRIVPGAAYRIIRKFESQTEHRQKLENRFVWTESIKSIGGLVGGFVIAMTAIIGGIYTSLHGQIFLGGTLSFAGLALLVGAFLANKQERKN